MKDHAMSPTRTVVGIFGAVYIVVGLLGFLGDPIVMEASHADMPSASGDLLGLFPINVVHNIVHLLIGAILLYGATERGRAILVARGVAVTYALVGILGLFAQDTFGLMPIGGNDVWLHLATAAVLYGVTLLDRREDRGDELRTA
jgi:Domain of unknown function (DUF4383)